MCFQVYFKPSHRLLKGNWSLRRRQRLPLRNSSFAITPSNSPFQGEKSMSIKEKDLVFREKVRAQSKRTAPPPISKNFVFSKNFINWYPIVFKKGRK